jgi:hypothetical protein
VSNETETTEIYVRPFPNIDEGKWQVTTDGGSEPAWAPDGSELFYLAANRAVTTVMVVEIETTPVFSAGTPTELFSGDYAQLRPSDPSYAVAPDGERFLMMRESDLSEVEERPPQFVIVQNWFEELRRLAPTAE